MTTVDRPGPRHRQLSRRVLQDAKVATASTGSSYAADGLVQRIRDRRSRDSTTEPWIPDSRAEADDDWLERSLKRGRVLQSASGAASPRKSSSSRSGGDLEQHVFRLELCDPPPARPVEHFPLAYLPSPGAAGRDDAGDDDDLGIGAGEEGEDEGSDRQTANSLVYYLFRSAAEGLALGISDSIRRANELEDQPRNLEEACATRPEEPRPPLSGGRSMRQIVRPLTNGVAESSGASQAIWPASDDLAAAAAAATPASASASAPPNLQQAIRDITRNATSYYFKSHLTTDTTSTTHRPPPVSERPCYYIMAGLVLGIIASLAAALWWARISDDVSAGFTVGSYVVGVVAVVLAAAGLFHAPRCRCWS